MFWLFVRIALVAAVVLGAVAWIGRGVWRARDWRRLVRRASAAFDRRRGALAEEFRQVAQQTGKPRGLDWRRCELTDGAPTLAVDRATGELVALAAVTVAFAATPGGDMEEVEAVDDLRDATAVFAWRDGRWQTDGRVVFNHSPADTLARYRSSLEPVAVDPASKHSPNKNAPRS